MRMDSVDDNGGVDVGDNGDGDDDNDEDNDDD